MHHHQPPVPPLAGRRADAGTVGLTDRDITGLMLCADHYAAPYDLLAAALDVRTDRLRGIVARWRHTGYAEIGHLGHRPKKKKKKKKKKKGQKKGLQGGREGGAVGGPRRPAIGAPGWPLDPPWPVDRLSGRLAARLATGPVLPHAAAWVLPMTAVYAIGEALRFAGVPGGGPGLGR